MGWLPDLVALGTMHGKEQAIAPPLAALGIRIESTAIDTDRFGTFSRNVPRSGNMLEAARSKARASAEATGLSVALASEGAYGSHPHIPFVPFGRELLLWLDTRTGREIVEVLTDVQPCYDQQRIDDAAAVCGFVSRIGFPTTAVTVQASIAAPPIAKGIIDRQALDAAVAAALAATGSALLQTDMRAHMNPRRMTVIADLARRLASRLAMPCPTCANPGFGILRSFPGLMCRDCGAETSLIAADIYNCTACGHTDNNLRAGNADPANCPYCNP